MIIVCANAKGGVGKSTLSQTLAVFIQKNISKNLLLIDTDPQETTMDWCSERNSNSDLEPIPSAFMKGNIVTTLQDVAKRYDFVVVDCGGSDSTAMRSALSVSDIAIVPSRPKRRDLKVAIQTAEIINQARALNHKLQVFSVITHAPVLPSQTPRILSAKEVLASIDLNPIDAFMRYLNGFDDSSEVGRSVLEWEHDPKAAEDSVAVIDEILTKSQENL